MAEKKRNFRPLEKKEAREMKKRNAIDQLNEAFGFDWDFELLEIFQRGYEIVAKGRLTVRTPSSHTLKREQYGRSRIKKGMSLGDGYKAAASDALEECASLLGIAGSEDD